VRVKHDRLPGHDLTTARPALSADTICNQAIASDAVVTQATITACNTANVPTEHKCTTGPSVYEAYIPTGNDAILRLGYKPQVYDSASFFVSELNSSVATRYQRGRLRQERP